MVNVRGTTYSGSADFLLPASGQAIATFVTTDDI
jgi:hypothetical protein